MKEHFTLTLKWSKMLCGDCRHMAFVREDGKPMPYVPGQFIQIHFTHDGDELRRSYSIATVPGAPGPAEVDEVELAISYVEGGAATALLSAMEAGDTLDTSGPYGRFCLHDNETPERFVLVATGTGVTPYRAMLPEIAHRMTEHGTRFVLVHGARRREEVLYGEDFAAFAQAHEGFEYHSRISRQQPADPRSWEHPGHVQDAFETLGLNPETDIVYLCGNPDMIDDSVTRLKEKGFTPRNLRREKYISNR
jgi:ferredoxin-NADP reductase